MRSQADQLEDAVVVSCDLLGRATAVRAIEVMTDLHPGYAELLHFRDLARAHGLDFVVLGSGGFVLRSLCQATAGAARDEVADDDF